MHSAQSVLDTLIPLHFDCIHHHQHVFSLSLWLLDRSNQSGNIWGSIHMPLLWAFQILDAIVSLNSWFNICCAIIFAVIWIIQIAIQVKPIVRVQNTFRCAILITFDWIIVDSSGTAVIQYLNSSSREVLCKQSWWQRRSFWQFQSSHTIMLKV